MRKSVSCCNPWCSDRALCAHCKALPGNATATDSERMQSSMRQIMAAETAGRVVQSDPSNLTPEWRAVTMALSGYHVQGPVLTATPGGHRMLATEDIIGIAKAVLGRMPDTSWGGLKLLDQAAIQFRKYEAHHRAKNTDESLAKAEVNAEIAGRIESYVDAEAKRDSGARGPAATLGNLLAVIHGDGGHRQAEVGTVEAAREAEEIVTAMRVKAEEAVHAARADALDDAAAIVARQYKIGGLNLTTMESCMQASWMFSNEAYRIREAAGLPNPGATEYMPAAEERLRRAILGDGAVTPEGYVKMPGSEAEAAAMVAVGEAFLKGRAEEAARS